MIEILKPQELFNLHRMLFSFMLKSKSAKARGTDTAYTDFQNEMNAYCRNDTRHVSRVDKVERFLKSMPRTISMPFMNADIQRIVADEIGVRDERQTYCVNNWFRLCAHGLID